MVEHRAAPSPEMIRETSIPHRTSISLSEGPQPQLLYGVNHHSTIPPSEKRPRFASELDDDDGVDSDAASLELERPRTGGVTVVRQPMPTVMIHLPPKALTSTKVVAEYTQR
jgi:hypothetical protein